jgi:hypothetical protein
VRTTLTLDDDVADRLRDRIRQSGHSLKDVVNETLRLGLNSGAPPNRPRMKWRKSPLQIGVPFVSTSELLERLEASEDNRRARD